MEQESKVVCRICGRALAELNFHLSKVHGFSKAAYLALHPDAPIISALAAARKSASIKATLASKPPRTVSEETRRKLSQVSKRKHEVRRDDPSYMEMLRRTAAAARTSKGHDYRHTQETRMKMSGPRPHVVGRKHSEETREKLAAAARGRVRGPHSAATIAAMRAAWVRRKSDKERFDAYRAATSARMSSDQMVAALRDRMARLIKTGNHNGKSKDTSLEQRMAEYLKTKQACYEPQFVLTTDKGAFTFDFLLPESRRLIEVDGEYWHRRNWMVLTRDRLKNALAREHGYVVVRISDKDWQPEAIFASDDEAWAQNERILARRHDHLLSMEPMTRRRQS